MFLPEIHAKRKALLAKNEFNADLQFVISMYVAAIRSRYPDEAKGLPCPEFKYASDDYTSDPTMIKFGKAFEALTWDDIKSQDSPSLVDLFCAMNLFVSDVCAWPVTTTKIKKKTLYRRLSRARNEIKKHIRRLNSVRREQNRAPITSDRKQIQGFKIFTCCVKRQLQENIYPSPLPSTLADPVISAPTLLSV